MVVLGKDGSQSEVQAGLKAIMTGFRRAHMRISPDKTTFSCTQNYTLKHRINNRNYKSRKSYEVAIKTCIFLRYKRLTHIFHSTLGWFMCFAKENAVVFALCNYRKFVCLSFFDHKSFAESLMPFFRRGSDVQWPFE